MEENKQNIYIIQPQLAVYRIPVYEQMGMDSPEVTVFHEGGLDGADTVIPHCKTKILRRINFIKGYYQKGLIFNILKKKPEKIFYYADLKNMTLWLSIIICKIYGGDFYLHGQGVFKKADLNKFEKLIWYLALRLCTKFIAYNELVSHEMEVLFPSIQKKITYCNNTLQDSFLMNIIPNIYRNKGILFIGRIREGANIELLANAVIEINMKNLNKDYITLNIVGIGDAFVKLKEKYITYSFIKWHGKIYSNMEIAKIAEYCSIGVYPGDGGLSVVHYMSLGLFPIVHGAWKKHMGPEPWYVKNISEQFLFDRNSSDSLKKIIVDVFSDDERLIELRHRSRKFFEYLSTPSYSNRLLNIINPKKI